MLTTDGTSRGCGDDGLDGAVSGSRRVAISRDLFAVRDDGEKGVRWSKLKVSGIGRGEKTPKHASCWQGTAPGWLENGWSSATSDPLPPAEQLMR